MCLLCIEYQKGGMTKLEAERNLSELQIDKDVSFEHAVEIAKLIDKEPNAKTK